MASSGKTSAIQLNQWVPTDPVLMDDFNADNQKIDAAVDSLEKSLAAAVGSFTSSVQTSANYKYVTGYYTGTGAIGYTRTMTFAGAFEPIFMFITNSTRPWWFQQAVFYKNCDVSHDHAPSTSSSEMVKDINFNGNKISWTGTDGGDSHGFNISGCVYKYFVMAVQS